MNNKSPRCDLNMLLSFQPRDECLRALITRRGQVLSNPLSSHFELKPGSP